VETEENWRRLLSQDVDQAEEVTRNHPNTSIIGVVLSFLTIAEELDHKVAHVDATTLAWCLTVSTLPCAMLMTRLPVPTGSKRKVYCQRLFVITVYLKR
jgi:hypothetical protein